VARTPRQEEPGGGTLLCPPWTLLRWAWMGQNGSAAGPDGDVGRTFVLGPVGKDRVLFFS
jgi:hypothetical protein